MPDLYLGVDPGKKGAWALLKEDGTLLAVEPLPYLGDRVDSFTLKERVGLAVADLPWPTIAANVEYPMAVQGQSNGEKAFLNCGIIICVLELLQSSINLPRPHVWKGKMNLSKDKTASVRMAVDLWPAWRHKFVGPRGGGADGTPGGMAEAALIAEWGRRANLRIRTPEPRREPALVGTSRFANGEWVE